jgi:uncharacterized membrane protein HdeD (DUF308 family)
LSSIRRVLNIIAGLLIIAAAVFLMMHPIKCLPFVLAFIGFGMTLRGIGALSYYFSMARAMVGGKSVLYRGIIYLDLGLLTTSISRNPDFFIIVYIAILNLFTGAVILLRAKETREMGSKHWKMNFILGIINIVTAIAVVVSELVYHSTATAVLVYAFGLIYSGITRIRSAFLKTAIVYIQ